MKKLMGIILIVAAFISISITFYKTISFLTQIKDLNYIQYQHVESILKKLPDDEHIQQWKKDSFYNNKVILYDYNQLIKYLNLKENTQEYTNNNPFYKPNQIYFTNDDLQITIASLVLATIMAVCGTAILNGNT